MIASDLSLHLRYPRFCYSAFKDWYGLFKMAKPQTPDETDSLDAQAPLLGGESHTGEDGPTPTSSSLSALVLYFMAIHFLLAFVEIILVAPLIKLFENSICLSYYDFPTSGVQEDLCKIPEIQGPLAELRGWKSSFDTIPGTSFLTSFTIFRDR